MGKWVYVLLPIRLSYLCIKITNKMSFFLLVTADKISLHHHSVVLNSSSLVWKMVVLHHGLKVFYRHSFFGSRVKFENVTHTYFDLRSIHLYLI